MKAANFTVEELREWLEYDPATGVFVWKKSVGLGLHVKAGDRAGRIHPNGYRFIGFRGKQYKAGRMAWFYVHGEWPTGLIDHKDLNRQNDAIENLREASYEESARNRGQRSDNTSGFKGVVWSKAHKKWWAQISVSGKRLHLGSFDTPEQAHDAYRAASIEHHGDFARP
jgi:hypothetical protein